jgi:nucleosome binding factor SPN SPT16 subunit
VCLNNCVFWPCTQQTIKQLQKTINNKKNTLKLKHLEIEWNLKKPLVFTHLHKAKERGKYQFEEQSKTTKGMEEQSKTTRGMEEQSKTTRGMKEQRNKNSRIRRRPKINKEVP